MKAFKINEITNKKILGRTVLAEEKPLPLFWAASGIELNVKSKEVWALISSDFNDQCPWVIAEVNGVQVARFIAPKEKTWMCLSRGMNAASETLVSIKKDTQAMPDDWQHSLFIHEIGLSDDGEFCSVKPGKLNIEFVGDSITSGEGLYGKPSEMDWISQWMGAGKTYAMQVCKALDADYSVLSQCGWGVCWGWDGNPNSALPKFYNQICGIMKGDYQKGLGACDDYAFDQKFDYVVINLGTNDNGAFFQPVWKSASGEEHILNKEVLVNGVTEFLKNVRAHNLESKILWVWGMIKLTVAPELILKGINNYIEETGDKNIFTLELLPMEEVETCDEDKGSRGHPGPKTHRLAAEKIINFIKANC